jgi:nucleotide-binding universal stress UspA family protein
MKRILHPSDFSAASRPAFRKTIELTKKNHATLELLHVMTPVVPIPGNGYVSPQVYDQLAASATAWARKKMEALLKKARTAGVDDCRGCADRAHRPGRARQAGRSHPHGNARPHRVLTTPAGQRGLPRDRDVALSRAHGAWEVEAQEHAWHCL